MSIQNVATSFSDHSAELQSLDRQRQLAMLLQNQALQPSDAGGMVGEVYVPQSPLQGMAKMLQMYAAGKMNDRLDEKQRGLSSQYNQQLAQGLQNYQKTMAGTPAQPGSVVESQQPAPNVPMQGPTQLPAPNQPAANFQDPTQLQVNANYRNPDTPAVPGNPMAAALGLASSDIPELRQLGLAAMLKGQKEQEAFTLTPGAQRYSPDGKLLASAPIEHKPQATSNLSRLIAERDALPPDSPIRKVYDDAIEKESQIQQNAGSAPFYNFLPTENGYAVGNARTGMISPAMINGRPVMKSSDSPDLQGRIAEAKAGGKELGESRAQSQINLPQATETANMAIKQIDDLLSHPGFHSTVGATLLPGARFVEGTKESDFMKRLDQLKGGAFLQAFESLKGGGQITEIEGKKATDAITRMDKAQSEKEFTNAAREFQGVIRNGVERAKRKAGTSSAATPSTAAPNVSIDDLLNKYK